MTAGVPGGLTTVSLIAVKRALAPPVPRRPSAAGRGCVTSANMNA